MDPETGGVIAGVLVGGEREGERLVDLSLTERNGEECGGGVALRGGQGGGGHHCWRLGARFAWFGA